MGVCMGGHVGSAGMNRGEWVARGGPSLNGNPPPTTTVPLPPSPPDRCLPSPTTTVRGRRGGQVAVRAEAAVRALRSPAPLP